MNGFWSMGGYAAFVWPAYGLSALGLGLAVLLTLRSWRAAKRRLVALEEGKP